MGLDISLIDADRAKLHKKMDDLWEADLDHESEEWKAQYAEVSQALLKSDNNHPSVRHPEHLMNRRYLRSSYNEGGFNNVCHDLTGLHGFYYVFEPLLEKYGVDEYEYRLTEADSVQLAMCGGRAIDLAARIRGADPLVVTQAYSLRNDSTEEQALEFARTALEKAKDGSALFKGGWSNAEGVFFGESGLNVLAVTTGKGALGTATSFLVHRLSDESKAHYVASAEITAEFIDEAITMIRDEGVAIMHWSG